MIKVRSLEVTKRAEVPWTKDLTVSQALGGKGVRVPAGGTVTVNGAVVTDLNTPVADNATIVVTPPVDNGGR